MSLHPDFDDEYEEDFDDSDRPDPLDLQDREDDRRQDAYERWLNRND